MDGAVTDTHALHVLTAYVEDEIHAGQELLRSLIVSHGLDYAVVNVEAGLDETLAVSRYGCIGNKAVVRDLFIYLSQEASGGLQRVSFVVLIEAVYQVPVGVYESSLRGGGTCVDTEVQRSLAEGKILSSDLGLSMAGSEGFKLSLVLKQRLRPLGCSVL